MSAAVASERTPLNGSSSSASSSVVVAHSAVSVASVQAPNETEHVAERLNSLRGTFRSGVTKPIEWRLGALRALREVMISTKDEIYQALHADLRKCAFETWLAEHQFCLSEIDEALHSLKSWMKPEGVNTNLLNIPGSSQLVKDPLGVVLIIAPWNYPFQLAVAPLIGALAAGNCVMMKPSELAPAVSAWFAGPMAKALDSYGVKVIQGGIAPTSALLKEQFDLIFYTGGGSVGKIILHAAAEHLTPVILELGGKSPALVLRDANLDVTARRLVWGKLMNAGQTCIAPDYVLCDSAVHDELISKLRACVKDMYGEDPRQSPDFGRIINHNHTARLTALVQPMEEGITPVVGDPAQIVHEEKYIPPLFLTGVKSDSRIMRDEIFGPILPILRMDGGSQGKVVKDMISFVSSRPKPLALYVFTESSSSVDEILRDTSSGGVAVNDCLVHVVNPTLPFGGVGPSGMGSYHGEKSFTVFSHVKSVLRRSGASLLDAPQRYPPYTPGKQTFMSTIMKVQMQGLYKPYWYVLSTIILLGVIAILVTRFAAPKW